jgi:multidrug efflux pump subunit AcrA (membrane-fusion protein)
MRFGLIRIFLCLFLLLIPTGCNRSKAASKKPEAPAKLVGEGQLTNIELTPEAEKRLGVQTSPVELKKLPLLRTYGGDLVLPPGATVIVSAPVAGTLRATEKQGFPKSGTSVVENQPMMSLIPLLSPVEKIALATQHADAAGLIQQAQTNVDANRIALDRAERMLKENVGTVRMVDEAKAQLTLSQKALDAAESRMKILDETQSESDSSSQKIPHVINSPQKGIVRAMHVLPDEVVSAGAVLFEVMNTNTLWVRVPVYVGEQYQIDLAQPAEIGDLSSRAGQKRVSSLPIAAPPTATALSSSVDLYYEVSNAEGQFRPGQRVSVQVPLVGNAEQHVVPWSAVVQDIYGGNWVYEKTAEHKYVRRRIQVKQVVDTWAVLEQTPPLGAEVVSTGAAEIFGTEFWIQK